MTTDRIDDDGPPCECNNPRTCWGNCPGNTRVHPFPGYCKVCSANTDPTSQTLCDDAAFDQFGDMFTPRELRDFDLKSPELAKERDQYLTEYAAAGIGDDQDPSYMEFVLTTEPGETSDEFAARAVAAATDLHAIRRMRPEDITQEDR